MEQEKGGLLVFRQIQGTGDKHRDFKAKGKQRYWAEKGIERWEIKHKVTVAKRLPKS